MPCDENGRVTFQGLTEEGLPSQLWFSGLYAAGRSAFTGMHGESPLAGNLLLDDLVSGKAAGNHASQWSSTANFGGFDHIQKAELEAKEKVSALLESDGIPVGKFASRLSSAFSSEQSSKADALNAIREIKDSGIRLTDDSLVMNTEMLEAIRLYGLASIAEAILTTG